MIAVRKGGIDKPVVKRFEDFETALMYVWSHQGIGYACPIFFDGDWVIGDGEWILQKEGGQLWGGELEGGD